MFTVNHKYYQCAIFINSLLTQYNSQVYRNILSKPELFLNVHHNKITVSQSIDFSMIVQYILQLKINIILIECGTQFIKKNVS